MLRAYGLLYVKSIRTTLSRSIIGNKIERTSDIPVPAVLQQEDLQPDHAIKFKGRKLEPRVYCSHIETKNPRAWVETLKCNDSTRADQLKPLGYVDLHPDIFSIFPRLDVIHKNLYWQAHYKVVDWRCITTRADLLYRSQKKPWPQKGLGKARHGNRRTHIWKGGGQCNGPRGPHSYFYLLPIHLRIKGLLSMLTVKHVQDDLRIVENLKLSDALEDQIKSYYLQKEEDSEILNENEEFRTLSDAAAKYLRDYVDSQSWGPSVLFITDEVASLPDLTIFNDEEIEISADNFPKDLGIRVACNSYSNFIEEDNDPLSSITEIPVGSPVPAPRAVHPGRGLTLMPLDGLNVWSMVYHDTVVFTLSALEKLESRLLRAQKSVIGTEDSGRDLEPIKGYADWLIDEDFTTDDVSAEDVRRERHFTGSIGDLGELKRKLS